MQKKKIIFLFASIIALLIIFFIYTTYNQEYVAGSDWYGYYSLSLLLKQGRLNLEVGLPPAQYPPIAPLSYFVKNGKVLPQYPPGYPLLMALAGFIGLEFYVTPVLGILSIVLMFLLVKDLADTWIAALGLKNLLTFIQSKGKPAKSLVNISLTILSAVIIIYFVIYGFNHGGTWEKNKGKIYYDASKAIGEAVPANSLVGSIDFSGCIRLYAGIETFNSIYYPQALFLISDLLKKRIPVYMAVEPWNREIPTIKKFFEVFKVEKVMAVKGWSDFYLYRIVRRQRKAYENFVRELSLHLPK